MPSVWEAPQEIRKRLNQIKAEHHPHLNQASMWVLCSDASPIRDNQFVPTRSQKCTRTEKLSSGHDFKVTVLMEGWSKLTDVQRDIALDEALCRCGVHRVPQTMEMNGRKEVVKDDLGRVIHTDEIAYDKEGSPKWKVNPPDAGLFYAMLVRHGVYSEASDNVTRALDNKPLMQPVAAEQPVLVGDEFG